MSYQEGSNFQAKKQDQGKKLFEQEVRHTLKGSTAPEGARQSEWRRYRFKTKSVDDCRPLIFNPKYPWWCSGYGMDGEMGTSCATIVAYLPIAEDLKKYWDDAFDIEFTDENSIKFSDRFPKPKYFKD